MEAPAEHSEAPKHSGGWSMMIDPHEEPFNPIWESDKELFSFGNDPLRIDLEQFQRATTRLHAARIRQWAETRTDILGHSDAFPRFVKNCSYLEAAHR